MVLFIGKYAFAGKFTQIDTDIEDRGGTLCHLYNSRVSINDRAAEGD